MVPGTEITVWWTTRTASKEGVDSDQPRLTCKRASLPTAEPRPRSQVDLRSPILPRPTPIRSFSPCRHRTTLVVKPKKSVVELLELAAVHAEEEELRLARSAKEETERKEKEASEGA